MTLRDDKEMELWANGKNLHGVKENVISLLCMCMCVYVCAPACVCMRCPVGGGEF